MRSLCSVPLGPASPHKGRDGFPPMETPWISKRLLEALLLDLLIQWGVGSPYVPELPLPSLVEEACSDDVKIPLIVESAQWI